MPHNLTQLGAVSFFGLALVSCSKDDRPCIPRFEQRFDDRLEFPITEEELISYFDEWERKDEEVELTKMPIRGSTIYTLYAGTYYKYRYVLGYDFEANEDGLFPYPEPSPSFAKFAYPIPVCPGLLD